MEIPFDDKNTRVYRSPRKSAAHLALEVLVSALMAVLSH